MAREDLPHRSAPGKIAKGWAASDAAVIDAMELLLMQWWVAIGGGLHCGVSDGNK